MNASFVMKSSLAVKLFHPLENSLLHAILFYVIVKRFHTWQRWLEDLYPLWQECLDQMATEKWMKNRCPSNGCFFLQHQRYCNWYLATAKSLCVRRRLAFAYLMAYLVQISAAAPETPSLARMCRMLVITGGTSLGAKWPEFQAIAVGCGVGPPARG